MENPYPVNTPEWLLHQEIEKEKAAVKNAIDQQLFHRNERVRMRNERLAAEARIARHQTALDRLTQPSFFNDNT